MTNLSIPDTGSIVVHARVWRSAPFPAGILYWDDFREIHYPVNEREANALHDERWRPIMKKD